MVTLVEQCRSLSITTFKPALNRLKRLESGFNGEISLREGLDINYWLDRENDGDQLTFSLNGQETQTVFLAESGLTYGLRFYFVCPDCGKRASKLYQLPTGGTFKCRKCHNLRYEISSLNRQSIQGLLGYRTNRMLKLIKSRELMTNRIIYNGHFTRRYCSLLNLSRHAGFGSATLEANQYLADVQALARERQKF